MHIVTILECDGGIGYNTNVEIPESSILSTVVNHSSSPKKGP